MYSFSILKSLEKCVFFVSILLRKEAKVVRYFKTCFLNNQVAITKLLYTLKSTSRMSVFSHLRNIRECQFNLA